LIFVLHAIAVVATGFAVPWMGSLFGSLSQIWEPFSLGPGRLLGVWWLVIGIPVAAVMVWRGSARVAALAGLVASPYLLPQHLLMGLIGGPLVIPKGAVQGAMPSAGASSPGAGD